MAEARGTSVAGTKKSSSSSAANVAAKDGAGPKPARRRISRRKAVEQHVRGYFDALSRRDIQAMAEYWTHDAVADVVPLGVLRGRDEIMGFYRELFAAVPDLETTVGRLVAGEHEAAVEWRTTGHFTGQPFQGMEPTGKRVELRGSDLLDVADGKNTALTAYYDGMSFARQIGLMPLPGSGGERAMKSAFNAATKVRRALAAKGGGR